MTLFLQGLYFNPVGISVGGMFLVTKESALTVSLVQMLKKKTLSEGKMTNCFIMAVSKKIFHAHSEFTVQSRTKKYSLTAIFNAFFDHKVIRISWRLELV